MIAVLLFGGGVGLGLWLVGRALTSRPTLAEVGAMLDAPGRAVRSDDRAPAPGRAPAIARRGTAALALVGLDPARRRADLRITRRSEDQHALVTLTWIAASGTVGGLVALAVGAGALTSLLAAVATGAGAALVEERALTKRAAEARAAFRHALSAYLDLVTVIESSGAGPETALTRAADAGEGWAFGELRQALARAERARRSAWDAIGQLGADLDITELSELAAAVALVEHEGARIRRTLEAKADAMRTEQLTTVKADAGATTERMTLPVVVLLMAFLVFIAYPAASRIGEVGGP